jgi:putative protein-disulfide isomerase
MTSPTRLLYVADPMCSWCFGFAPVLAGVEPLLGEGVELSYVMGGLAPDSDEPMDDAMRRYVQNAWRAVEERTGARFDFSFWERHRPARSTWPACRAVLAAGERGREMFAAVQRAYYREARDPSDRATLVELATELGLDGPSFARAIDAPETRADLAEHFALRGRLGATSFPSVGVERGAEVRLLAVGWVDPEAFRALLAEADLLG